MSGSVCIVKSTSENCGVNCELSEAFFPRTRLQDSHKSEQVSGVGGRREEGMDGSVSPLPPGGKSRPLVVQRRKEGRKEEEGPVDNKQIRS